VHDVTLSGAASTATLTLGLMTYAALILVGISVAIFYARRHRRRRSIAAAVVVGVLTVCGLVIAIVSSVV